MKIVVGLGNPGDQYAKTRHNIGWMVLDRLADRAGWAGKGRTRDAAAIAMGRYRGLDLMVVKPLTFMNESGLAVRKVLAREHAPRVRFVGMAPGRIDTDRVRSLNSAQAERTGKPVEDVRAASEAEIPMRRYGEPEEFGRVAAFLLSPAASYVSGSTVQVDGALITAVP